MLVKVKIYDVLTQTEKATLFLFKYEREVWLPKNWFRWGRGNYIIIQKWLALEKGLEYSELMHVPEKIQPKYNQEAIDALKY